MQYPRSYTSVILQTAEVHLREAKIGESFQQLQREIPKILITQKMPIMDHKAAAILLLEIIERVDS